MPDSTDQARPVVAPPILIGICIVGAVVAVIISAALYKLCRRATAGADDEEVGDQAWNPNRRGSEQIRYMEEVRMRNKMFAWDRSRAERAGRHDEGLFKKQYEVSDWDEIFSDAGHQWGSPDPRDG